ncbi:MAG: 5-(carboxyamino)imidazole ribonucleotide mutase [candidate division Zixibacteria bacterium]|nr:5-(carboxyamino)imidazole ribonucleotide mutase [candidate division Zixibacteria bacterium]
MQETVKELEKFGIGSRIIVSSAHRDPEKTGRILRRAERDGYSVVIAAAGMAAHLAGKAAAETVLPVIGVPLNSSTLGGLDALLSTVQMPSGVPVATVSIGKSGAVNAAWLAVQILSTRDKKLRERLRRERSKKREELRKKAGRKNA